MSDYEGLVTLNDGRTIYVGIAGKTRLEAKRELEALQGRELQIRYEVVKVNYRSVRRVTPKKEIEK